MLPSSTTCSSDPRSWLALLGRYIPSQCTVCRSWPSAPVCGACLLRFGTPRARCPGCALEWTTGAGGADRCPDCLRQPLPLDGCFAALNYGFPWSQVLTDLKFRQQTGWTSFLAERLLAQPGVADVLAQLSPDDWLLAMPLSQERLAERGFNQAWELVKALRRASSCRARAGADLLMRIRHTPPQSQLRRTQRLENVRGAFVVEPLQVLALAGKSVVLVDDVMTSGASLGAAAQALKTAGAAVVTGLVAARTPP